MVSTGGGRFCPSGSADTQGRLAQRLSDQFLGRDVKAFLLTGDTSSRVQIIARENDAFLMSKPINADKFLGLLRLNYW